MKFVKIRKFRVRNIRQAFHRSAQQTQLNKISNYLISEQLRTYFHIRPVKKTQKLAGEPVKTGLMAWTTPVRKTRQMFWTSGFYFREKRSI